MPTATILRRQIESVLANRVPSALTPAPRTIRPVAATGIPSVDELLDGGLPVGAITEIVGPECSGRTSFALSFVAGMTQAEKVCAWIDVSDSLDPESAAAAGVGLSHLLWVRCGVPESPSQRAFNYQFTLPDKYLVPPPVKQGLHGGGFGPHPRNETKGLSEAVGDLLKPEVTAPRSTKPQPMRHSERRRSGHDLTVGETTKLRTRAGKPWARIERALSATDFLLQGGGFSAIVLDMAGVAPQYASRVELSIWFRYRAAVERTQASLLLLTQHPCAKSAGELLLRFQPGNARNDEMTVFSGIEHSLEVERRRFAPTFTNVIPLKKPPQRDNDARWRSQSAWAGAR
jgi:hypothetical protein